MVNFYECEDKAFEKELNIWATFYMEFNDDNKSHCNNALFNFIAKGTVEDIRRSNFEWFQEIKKHGVSAEEIIEIMPDAKEYCGEDDLKSLLKIR